jgi:uncharacterized membrane protein YoaK (UPF0700 family)
LGDLPEGESWMTGPVKESKAPEVAVDRAASLGLSTCLVTAGGFLDGYTFVGHGHVFTNAMTGNVVLLGIEMLSFQRQQALNHLTPLVTFVVGIWAARALHLRATDRGRPSPYAAVLLWEIGILFMVSWLPASCPDIVITTCVVFAASLQVQTFRTVLGHAYTSTFTTGNLRNLSEAIFDRVTHPDSKRESENKARIFGIICTCFLIGATGGAYATRRIGNHALWVELVLLLLALERVRTRSV